MIQGISMETIYFYVLIVCAVIASLLIIFGNIIDFDGPIDPILSIPWLAFTSLSGYLSEKAVEGNHLIIFLMSALVSSILVFLLNFYVIVPIKNAEATISISEKDLEGHTAIITTPIPTNGMGEIHIKSVTGSINRPAAFYSSQEHSLARGEQVLVIEIKNRVCYVVPYKGDIQL